MDPNMHAVDGIFVLEPVSWGSDQKTENVNGRLSFAGELPFIVCKKCRSAQKKGLRCVAPDSIPLWKPENAHWPTQVTSRAELQDIITIAMQDPRNQVPNRPIDRSLIPDGMSLLPAELYLGADKRCALLLPSRLVISETLRESWNSQRLSGAQFIEVQAVMRGKPIDRRFYLCFVEARPFLSSHGPFERCDCCGQFWIPNDLLPDPNPYLNSDLAWYGDTKVLLASQSFKDAVAATGELSNVNFVPFVDWFRQSYH